MLLYFGNFYFSRNSVSVGQKAHGLLNIEEEIFDYMPSDSFYSIALPSVGSFFFDLRFSHSN